MTFGSGGQRSNPLSYGWKRAGGKTGHAMVPCAVWTRNDAGMRWTHVEAPAMSNSPLRVLLTGAGGRIGPHILTAFRERFDLRLLDRTPVDAPEPTLIADLSDQDVLENAMAGIDVVVHLAATSDEAPFVEQLLPANIVGMVHLLGAAKQTGVRRVVFASTVQTVGNYPPGVTIRASDPPRPVTHYGCTKAFGEVLGRYYHDAFGLEFVAVRIGWFHPYDSPLLRTSQGARDLWLSPRDAAGILAAAADQPNVGYAVVNATSVTEFERLSRTECREVLGYHPVDDIAGIPNKVPTD